VSYIQLEIGGKLRGLKFNQLSLEVYTKNLNYGNAINASTIYATFYAGLVANCYVKQEEPDFTFEDVTNWVDELYEQGRKKDIEKVCNCWAETHTYREWLEEFKEKLRSILEPEKKTKKKAK
jgi:hypothetical protein